MLAESWKQQWNAITGKELYVDIIPYKAFYPAEDYHQKYYLKMQASPYQELKRIYPEENQLVNSTAAARINGYMAGYGTFTRLQQQIDMYGLSEAGKKELLEIGRRRIIDTEIGDLCPVP
jgi:peptide-methionine (S)-S-oxide reductase